MWVSLSNGLSWWMKRDSMMRKSIGSEVLQRIVKLSKMTGTSQPSASERMDEWGGFARRFPVLKLLFACSATRVLRVRVVEPTYSKHTVRNWACRPQREQWTNSEFINKYYVEIYLHEKLGEEWFQFFLSFSDWGPKYGREKKYFCLFTVVIGGNGLTLLARNLFTRWSMVG